MKIILRADVENLGRLGDVVTVKAGYGRNYLLPQGLAMLVTPGNLKAFELERKKLQARMDALRAAADDIAGKLEGLVLPIVMRVGDNDKLYGSVTTAIIGDALTAQGIEVDRRRILLDHPIRTLGDHPVRVRLHADVVASLTVKVVSEDKAHLVEEEAAEAPAEAPPDHAAEECRAPPPVVPGGGDSAVSSSALLFHASPTEEFPHGIPCRSQPGDERSASSSPPPQR